MPWGPITASKVDEADLAGAASGRVGTLNTSPQEDSVRWVKRRVAKGLQLSVKGRISKTQEA